MQVASCSVNAKLRLFKQGHVNVIKSLILYSVYIFSLKYYTFSYKPIRKFTSIAYTDTVNLQSLHVEESTGSMLWFGMCNNYIFMGMRAKRNCAIDSHFVHGELALGILCGKWYAIENVWGRLFLSFWRYYLGILYIVRCTTMC